MKFLSKSADSPIHAQGLNYIKGDNTELRNQLLAEQKNFCAYTEKFIEPLDSVDVEHFNKRLKYNDDYYNYYTVIHKANRYKKDRKYIGATFFETLFFQKEFDARIKFVPIDMLYVEIDLSDTEAAEFIDFIGLNNDAVYKSRKKHVERLREQFPVPYEMIAHFRKYREQLKFITAIEAAFNIDLSEFYK